MVVDDWGTPLAMDGYTGMTHAIVAQDFLSIV